MFKFSFEWLKDLCGDIDFPDLLKILNIQGFEVDSQQQVENDMVTTIEVKANRPDMLSHIGVAREINAFRNLKIPEIEKSDLKVNNTDFPAQINVCDIKACRRFSGIILNGIDNTVETPLYIRKILETLGINLVNPVVDITNYVMLELGQPMHSYDVDKLDGKKLIIEKSKSESEITTLAQNAAKIKVGDITISDDRNILCVAGVIGTNVASVEKQTKNVLLEAAIFDEVDVRLTSRTMKISTPSSFRFERGVNIETTMDILWHCARLITTICGGTIHETAFDFYPHKEEDKSLNLRVSRANALLGTNIDSETMIKYLEKYNFKCIKESDNIIMVQIPDYRLDVQKEVDLIEEVARIYGYDNIAPVMPRGEVQYNKNAVWASMDVIRGALSGLDFAEVVNYSFIPSNSMDILGLNKENVLYSDLTLQNPIAEAYALMRPTLAYSLINCLAYNYSRNNPNLALFELGKVYFKDENLDTGVRETETLGMILSGNRVRRGWGAEKDIKYTYYDLLNYVSIIFNKFGQEFRLEPANYPFCESGTSFDIMSNGKRIGFIGEFDKSGINKIQNVKLIKDKVFYCEIYVNELHENIKTVQFESKYPSVNRLYNLVCKKDIPAQKIIDTIKSSSNLIRSISVNDIYEDKKLAGDEHAVLFEINYCSKTETLTSEQIEKIENKFLKVLSDELKVEIKK